MLGIRSRMLKGLRRIEALYAWFWREGVENEPGAIANCVHGMHFYPTLLLVEKRPLKKPLVTPVGHTPSVAQQRA